MKAKILYIFILVFSLQTLHAQVGIGTTDPKANLDIPSSNVTNPTNTDGILIPRIDNFPTVNPSADQDGMMVFATGNGTPSKGFYYWDNTTTSWNSVRGSDTDFYEIGTTSNPDAITDDIYTLGKLKIGQNSSANSSLSIHDWNANNFSAFNISRSLNTASPTGQFSGSYIAMDAQTSDNYSGYQSFLSGNIQAESSNFYALASGTLNGFTNLFSGSFNSASGNGRLYGAKVNFMSTVTNTGNKYGFNVNIPSSLSGTHYGIYSDVQNSSGYAAYLIGKTSLGNTSANRYVMPSVDGTAGQVMTTDGAGQLSFEDLSGDDADWLEIGTTNAPDSNSDHIFTLGKVNIGDDLASSSMLRIFNDTADTPALSIDNTITQDTDTFIQANVQNNTTVTGTGTGSISGFSNLISGTSPAIIYNHNASSFVDGSASSSAHILYRGMFSNTHGDGPRYGSSINFIWNSLGSGVTGSGDKVGYDVDIDQNIDGTHYGYYADVRKTSGYAAYFIGRTSLGTGFYNRYLMPEADGNANQVIITDGAGNLSFQDITGDGNTQNTLGQAYDEGGSGAGRDIIANAGDVQILGDYGLFVEKLINEPYAVNIRHTGTTDDAAALFAEVTNTYTLDDKSAIKTSNALTRMNVELNKYRSSTNGGNIGVLIDNDEYFGGKGVSIEFSDPTTVNYNLTNIGFNYDILYNGSSAGTLFGFKSRIEGSGLASKYGLHIEIPSTSGGANYGIFSDVQSTSGYAGYFAGRVELGHDFTNRYFMPGADGTNGQVMTTDGAGNVTFQDISVSDSDWFEVGSTNAPNSLNDDKYTGGSLSIGKNTAAVAKVDIETNDDLSSLFLVNNTNTGSIKNGILNVVNGTTSPIKHGIVNTFNNNANGILEVGVINNIESRGSINLVGYSNFYTSTSNNNNGTFVGFQNTVGSQHQGSTIGLVNNFNTSSGINPITGVRNIINATGNGIQSGSYTEINSLGSGNKFGHNVNIPITAGGTHYGFHADVQSSTGYAGYFIGRTSFGNSTTNRYLMPAADGSNGQVMTTDGSGNVTFQNPNTGTDNQQIDSFSFNSSTNELTLEIEDDGQAAQTVDLSSLNPDKAIARLFMSASQTETGSGITKVNFDSTEFDIGSNFNTTTDEYEIPETAIYRVTAQITMDASTGTGTFDVRIRVNGTQERRAEYNHTGNGQVLRQITSILSLTAGDTLDIAFNRPAVGATIQANSRATFFEIEQL